MWCVSVAVCGWRTFHVEKLSWIKSSCGSWIATRWNLWFECALFTLNYFISCIALIVRRPFIQCERRIQRKYSHNHLTLLFPLFLSFPQPGSFAIAGIAGVIQFSDCEIVRHISAAALYLQNISEYATEWHCAMNASSAVLSFVPFYFLSFARSQLPSLSLRSIHMQRVEYDAWRSVLNTHCHS